MKNIRFLLPAIFAAVLMAIGPMAANAQSFSVRVGEPYYGYHRYHDWDRGYWRPYRSYVDYNNPWYWRHHRHHRPWYTQWWY